MADVKISLILITISEAKLEDYYCTQHTELQGAVRIINALIFSVIIIIIKQISPISCVTMKTLSAPWNP